MSVCISIAASSLGDRLISELRSEVEGSLAPSGPIKYEGVLTERSDLRSLPFCPVRIIVVGTGGTEAIILELSQRSSLAPLVYHGRFNSLPATMEALSELRARGTKSRALRYEGGEWLRKLAESYSRAVNAWSRLKGARFGIIGGISPWLVFSKTNPELLREKLGAEAVEIGMDELISEFSKIGDDIPLEEIARRASEVRVPGAEIAKAYKVYLALRSLIERYRLDGLTIKCFDLIKETGTTACLALSLLNTAGFPAACEGDVPLLISMAIGTWSTGKPVFMGNIAEISGSRVILAHCTSPLVGGYRLLTHFESDMGVGIRVDYPIGEEATLYRLHPSLRAIRIGIGRIAGGEWRRDMCRTQIHIELRNARKLLEEPIGNHYALVIGDHVEEIASLSELLGIDVEEI